MYLRHFALTRLPFETPAHTDELFESNARREAEARLHHLIELKGIGLVTGEVGSGKTTVCRHVASALHPGLYRVGYVSLTTGNVLDMYKAIAWELGLPTERSRATAYRAIRAEVTRLVGEARQLPILVIDEAQHLRNDVLEDLRLLCNYEMDSENRLCLLLVGLTELRRRLAMACHESLAQRLVVRHHLRGLDRAELDAYLAHRLHLAGCELPLFDPPAVEALAHKHPRAAPAHQPHRPLRTHRRRHQRRSLRHRRAHRARRRGAAAMIVLHFVPEELSDEAAAHMLEYLHGLAGAFENQYFAQIRRYYDELAHPPDIEHAHHDAQLDLFEEADMPF